MVEPVASSRRGGGNGSHLRLRIADGGWRMESREADMGFSILDFGFWILE
jgi:hypothetical protein